MHARVTDHRDDVNAACAIKVSLSTSTFVDHMHHNTVVNVAINIGESLQLKIDRSASALFSIKLMQLSGRVYRGLNCCPQIELEDSDRESEDLDDELEEELGRARDRAYDRRRGIN